VAQQRETASSDPAARRLGAGLTGGVCLLIGLLLAVAYLQASAGAPRAASTRAALAADARSRAALTDRLGRQAAVARRRLSAERASALADSAAGREVADRLRGLELASSLLALSGPGLIVTAADAPVTPDPVTGHVPTIDPTGPGRVQDRDLASIVNGLWAAGAEAVAVDGQRLSPVSTIRSAGGAILVDFRPVSSPYEVRAIGDADRMQARFADSAVVRSFTTITQLYGVTLTVARRSRVDVAAASSAQLTYAVPQGPAR